MADEDAASCRSCLFRLRYGFRRALYDQLFLNNPPLVAFANMLGINGGGDVPRILRVFLDVDVRGRHKLDIETFFEYFNIEFTEYNRMAFRLIAFGGQDTGGRKGSMKDIGLSLSFDQFFVSMYNYGTLLHEALVRFAFDVMAAGKEFCNKQDVIALVSLLHSDVARIRDTTSTLMGIMDPHNRDRISFSTFRKEERRLGSMLFPAFKLQKVLRAKVLGQWFWRKATKKRRKARLVGADLCREYNKLKDASLREAKPAGVGAGGGGGVGGGSGGVAQMNAGEGEGEFNPRDPATTILAADEDHSQTSNDSSEPPELPLPSRRTSSAAQQRGAEKVSIAASGQSTSMLLAGTGANGDINRRRRSTLKEGYDTQRQSHRDSRTSIDVARRRSTVTASSQAGRRKSSLASLSSQGVPGRRGSMFEHMEVFDPSTAPLAADRRRSSTKSSKVAPGHRSFTGSVAE